MPSDESQENVSQQESPVKVESFAVFRFKHGLGKGIKGRLKSLGCNWNGSCQGWLCSFVRKEEVQKAVEEAALQCEMQVLSLPQGMIPSDPEIASRQVRLEILEEQVYKNEMLLLQDVCQYDPILRSEDFSQLPCGDGKSLEKIQIERDFHVRWVSLQKMKEEIALVRQELLHLTTDASSDQILDSGAPLSIAEALIKGQFLWETHRTLYYCSNMFWQWDGMKYVALSEEGMRQKMYSFLREAKEISRMGHLEDFNPTKFKVDQIIDALQATCYYDYHPSSGAIWLDGRESPDPRYLISFKNGLLSIKDWLENPVPLLQAHTPLLMSVNALSFDFDPLASKPQEWLHFLSSLWGDDQESQETLQEWMGYSLTHETRFHKILLILGPSRSGKGTIGRCLLDLLGDFNVIGPTLSSLNGDFGLQPFLNKMLALISDARLSSRGNNSVIMERLLSVSGEDPLTINRKFLPSLTIQLPTRIMIMSNEIPEMRDASGALAKRYLVLTLTKSWLGNEDTMLSARLRTELPSILLWALQGLDRLQKRGKFVQPSSSAPILEELDAVTSPIKAFVAERCVFKPYATTSIGVLFEAWQYWCTVTGYSQAGNKPSFGKNLRAAFPDIETTRPQGDHVRERLYKGICLRSSPSADVRGPT